MPPVTASPPKRMTRARARAVEEGKDTMRSITVATASSRAILKTTNRKAELQDASIETDTTKSKPEAQENKRTTRKPPVPKVSDLTNTKATRGRTKKAQPPSAGDKPDVEVDEKPAPVARIKVNTTRTTHATTKAPQRKQVTFQEHHEEEKENTIRVGSIKSKAKAKTSSTTTERAAPVGIVKSTGTRNTRTKPGVKVQHSSPLSPKKAIQVAKARPVESEDELSGDKTPLKPLSKSPVKATATFQSSPTRMSVNNDRSLNVNLANRLQTLPFEHQSPTQPFKGSIMASPARRPPPSPFKDLMRSSPKKLVDSLRSDESKDADALKSSTLLRSPVRFNIASPSKGVQSQHNNHQLSLPLMQSPARRLISPFKSSCTSSIKKMEGSLLSVNAASRVTTHEYENTDSLLSEPVEGLFKTDKRILVENEVLEFGPQPGIAAEPSNASRSVELDADKDPDGYENSVPFTIQETENTDDSSTPSVTSSQVAFQSSVPGPFFPRDLVDDDDSEDELQSNEVKYKFGTPTPARSMRTPKPRATPGPMTVLAQRFSEWQTTSPRDGQAEPHSASASVPSLSPSPIVAESKGVEHNPEPMVIESEELQPQLFSAFDEAMSIREDAEDVVMASEASFEEYFKAASVSDVSEEYGDENVSPAGQAFCNLTDDKTMTCTPARIVESRPQIVHTVSKVPLKPAANGSDSPLQYKPIRRSKSLCNSLSPRSDLEVQILRQINPLVEGNPLEKPEVQLETPRRQTTSELVSTPIDRDAQMIPLTPFITPRADLNSQLLRGAVVFVDVHTTEGADASGIFVELLGQMGAKCVKSWNWNPRSSVRATDAPIENENSNKIGITHVVFKDGGKRTMEKVRQTKGIVLCVGVAWVLDCERENKWMDEAEYTVDSSTIPRGGHRRRKSMEPKRLSSFNGSLFDADLTTRVEEDKSKDVPDPVTPRSRRQSFAALPTGPTERRVGFATVPETLPEAASRVPVTPLAEVDSGSMECTTPDMKMLDSQSALGSPTTPYFLHKEQLQQQTCPPKQTQQLLFPLSGKIDDQPDAIVRRRLLLARRKSLQWAPKVGSGLRNDGA